MKWTILTIRMNKQEMDKAIANGDYESAKRRKEDLEEALKEYKDETGEDYELEETSKEIIEKLTKMDREAARLERMF